MGLDQCDHINQMITLSVITLSSFHCIFKYVHSGIGKFDHNQQKIVIG
jgi:hypothetical protein